MRSKFKFVGLLAVVVVGILAMSGIAAGSASAAACVKVKEPSTEGSFKKRNANTGMCEEEGTGAAAQYTEVTGLGRSIPKEPADVLCFKVAAGHTANSLWGNAECTEDVSGGGFIKALTACEHPFLIMGQGSSLQKSAQQSVWNPESNCGVGYESTSSGSGRKAWGAESAGSATKPSNSGDEFIGSDEPLSEAQLKNLDEAANGTYSKENTGGEGQTLVIPVLQAAVAVIVHPPAGCTPTQINNKSLLKVWNGETKKWSEIKPTPSGTCTGSITRVVRADVSGTTFVFKTYLNEVEVSASGPAPCNKTWAEMAEPANNKVWPEASKEGCPAGLSPVKEAAETGGGGEVNEVKATEGAIGYANLGDARKGYTAKELEWLEVQNNGTKETGTPTYAKAGTAGTEPGGTAAKANCAETSYGTPPPATADDNLSELNGAHPSATNYPICTLTYDIALVNYEKAGYGVESSNISTATSEYLNWVVSSSAGAGQEKITENHDYDALPEGTGKILKFAQEVATKI